MRRAGLIAALLAGCGPPPTLKNVQAEVFAKSCNFSACHVGTGAEGLNLESPVHAKLVNVKAKGALATDLMLVVPGKPAESYLYLKLSQDMPRMGVRMPNTGDPLDGPRLAMIRDWIAAGAENN